VSCSVLIALVKSTARDLTAFKAASFAYTPAGKTHRVARAGDDRYHTDMTGSPPGRKCNSMQ